MNEKKDTLITTIQPESPDSVLTPQEITAKIKEAEELLASIQKELIQLDQEDALDDLKDAIQEKRKELKNATFKKSKKEELTKLETQLDRLEHPFKWMMIDKISNTNYKIIFGSLEAKVLDSGLYANNIDGSLCQIFDIQEELISERKDAVAFSSNGFYLKLTNRRELEKKDRSKKS